MKKVLVLMVAMLFVVAAVAYGDIRTTKHDLTNANPNPAVTIKATNTTVTDPCAFCHTAHNSRPTSPAPLWNRAASTEGTYGLYNTIQGTAVQVTPGTISLACLSCHDGSIGTDSLFNPPVTGQPTFNDAAMAASAGNVGATTAALQSQHPVGLVFNDGGNKTGLVGTTPLNNLPLYSATPGGATRNRVECATCHSVHSNTNVPFLRVPNAQVCGSCHTN